RAGTGRRAAGENVFAVHGRPRPDSIHSQRKNGIYRAGRFVGENFRPRQACERVAVERTLRLFRATRSKSKTGHAIEWSRRTGASDISHGEHGGRTAYLSVLRKIRSANWQRQHG